MSNHTTRPAPPRPDHSTAECHASREPFDAAFRCINERRDISPAAKLVHARLVTLHRLGRDETQAVIGEALGMSRHQVWRAIGELVTVDLVQIIRYGLGRPNGYVLLGVDQESLAGRSPKGGRASASRPGSKPGAGQPRTPARAFNSEKKKREEPGYIPGNDYLETRSHEHTDYLETRYGRLRVNT